MNKKITNFHNNVVTTPNVHTVFYGTGTAFFTFSRSSLQCIFILLLCIRLFVNREGPKVSIFFLLLLPRSYQFRTFHSSEGTLNAIIIISIQQVCFCDINLLENRPTFRSRVLLQGDKHHSDEAITLTKTSCSKRRSVF